MDGKLILEIKASAQYIWIAVGVVFIGLMLLGSLVWLVTRPKKQKTSSLGRIAEDLSPFAAISLLQDIHENNGLSDRKKDELAQAIDRLEAYYFSQTEEELPVDLSSEVKKWTRQSRFATRQ